MRPGISKFAAAVRASYWFVPSVMAFLAIWLGAGMVWVDAALDLDWLSAIGWYQSVKPAGAHEVLSTIAGSMITVAGVVFSITIVAIAYASSQYGPRVLTNFMSDRGNQVTLGTFIATFVYCLVVLRTIRGGDEGAFVPQMAVLVGLLLALCSIAVFIYFIHHVPQSIHINNVVAEIGRQLIAGVGRRFPSFIGDSTGEHEEVKSHSFEALDALTNSDGGRGRVAPVEGRATGYIQSLDEDALMDVARKHGLFLRLRYKPGDYLVAGRTLLDAWPAERLTDEAADALRDAHTTGSGRTPHGDLFFLISELVEIASRALSTGVNDPVTANTCFDWLGAGASEIARRRMPSQRRVDKEGTVRVIALAETLEDFVARSFGRVRQYAARDMAAALHLLRTIGEVAASCRTDEQVHILSREADRLLSLAEPALEGAALEAVRARAGELKALLALGAGRIDEHQARWLGGSA